MSGGEIEFKPLETQDVDVEAGERPHVYTPSCPENAPAVLTFSNISVSKRGGNKKALLKNISGSITGGLWAIMGKQNSTSLFSKEVNIQLSPAIFFLLTLRIFW